MIRRLEGKIALITGAAQGIGRASASLFVKEGAFVYLTDMNDLEGQAAAQELGAQVEYLHLDVEKEEEWKKTVHYILGQKKKLDILVNNAGITGNSEKFGPQDPEHASLNSWRKVHAINAEGVFLGCKYAIDAMKQGKGTIVNVSSCYGLVGAPDIAAYASSKASVRNHTKSVALYCCQKGYDIRCNSVHPGAILTPIWEQILGSETKSRQDAIREIAKWIPMKRMGDPEDVAFAILFLASDESKYITGIELNIDGGLSAGRSSSLLNPK